MILNCEPDIPTSIFNDTDEQDVHQGERCCPLLLVLCHRTSADGECPFAMNVLSQCISVHIGYPFTENIRPQLTPVHNAQNTQCDHHVIDGFVLQVPSIIKVYKFITCFFIVRCLLTCSFVGT